MPAYKNGEDTYNLPENRVAEFLEKYPNATLIEEEEIVEKPTPLQQESAPVKANGALDNTELLPADTSSELPLSYKVGDDIYNLPNKGRVAELLSKYPNAVPYEGKESIQELQSKTPDEKPATGFFNSMSVSFLNALDNIELQKQSAELQIDVEEEELDPKNVTAYVKAMQNVNDNQEIQSIKDYDAVVTQHEKDGGNGFIGVLKGLAAHPEAGFPMAINSFGTMVGSLAVAENLKEIGAYGAAGATLGAGIASVAGTAVLPVVGTAVGAAFGAKALGARGLYFGMIKQMETNLFFTQLLNENIEGEITDEKVAKVFEDQEFVEDMLNKANNRGLGVAAIEVGLSFLPGKVAGKIMGTLGRAGAGKIAPIVAGGVGAVVTEAGVGMLGEATGQIASGQEINLRDITEEGIISPYGKATSLSGYVSNVRTFVDEVKVSSTLKPTKYNNISELYTNEITDETQIKLSKLKRSQKLLDLDVNRRVNNNEITKEEGNNIKNNFRATQGAVNQVKSLNFNTEQETKSVELLKEKNKLENQIKKVGDTSLTKPEQERVDAINKELGDLRVERAVETIAQGVDSSRIITYKNSQELKDKYNIDFDKDSTTSAKESPIPGAFVVNGKFYINEEVAGQYKNVTEPAHELLHPILKQAFRELGDSKEQTINEFKKIIGPNLTEKIETIIKNTPQYNTVDKNGVSYMQKNPDEFFTIFTDIALDPTSYQLKEGSVFNENLFTKIGDFITPLLRKFGFKKIKFDTGKDVYNFMREYSRNIKEGKLSEDVKAVIPKNLKTNANESTQETNTNTALSVKKATVLEDINKLVPQDITTQEEYQSFLNDSRAFPKLFNAINNQGGVINNYIRSISTSQAETEKTIENLTNRILKFNPETKRANNTAVGIEAFGERVFADVQFAKLGSKKELFQESEKTKQESRIEDREDGFEVAAETEVEATSTAPTQGRKLVKSQSLSKENQKALEKVVAESNLTEEQLTFKTLPNAAIEIFAKQIGIPTKKFDGKANFTRNELDKVINFIEENISTIRQALPEAAVAEGSPVSENLIGTATGVPNNLLKDSNLYTRQDRGTRLSGLIAYVKNKGIDNSSILKAIGNVDGRRMASPRDKQAQTAKGLINMLAKFATNQEVRLQKDLTSQQTTNIETGKGSQVLFSVKNPVTEENVQKALDNNSVFSVKKAIIKAAIQDYRIDTKKAEKLIEWGTKYYTYEDFENQLEKDIKNKVDKNFIRNYFDNKFWMFGVFADAEAKNKGIQYEKYVNKVIKALSLDNVSVELLGGNDPTNPDLRLKIGNTNINIELKLNAKAQMGSFTIRPDGSFSVPGIENLNIGKQIKKQINSKEYKKALKNFNNRGIDLGGKIINGQLRAPRDVFITLQQEGLQSKLNINNVIGNEEVVNIIYNRKGIFTMEIGDKGLLYLGENKYNTQGLPKLEGQVRVYVRRVRTGSKDGLRYTTLRAFPTFISDINTSPFTLSDPTQVENTIMAIKQGVETPIKQENLVLSVKKATEKNNNKLPASQKLPKNSTNEQVLAKMRELDNQANAARAAFSVKQDLDDDFNKIIEAKTGIKTYKRFDRAGATVKGASKGKFNFFIPPSAEDFVGLLYKTLARGKVGDIQMQWFKDNLINPYARAMNDVSSARVAMFEDYKTLKNDLKIIPKDLKKKSFDEYTREQAVRVYIWDQQGNKIPGIFKTNQQSLVDYVNNNADLKAFADQLVAIQKGDQYSSPNEGWLAGSITTDLLDSVNSVKRKKYLEQWQTNVDEIFGENNMNKLEAAFGKPYREALTNILTRMKTGRNKPFTSDSLAGRFTNWLNNSVGAIMFFNTRSAVLQLLSSINFVNFTDNNPLKAGVAFANQPQYWKDFKFLFNSDFLKERRGGLRFNVSESEIADAAQKGGARGVVSKILQAGFLPTQMADSFAIATGGATFYRNRVKTYIKQGLTEAEANEKAFEDFRETAEESQQSSRPDRISAQQAGPLGRTILAFANTPAQYARLTKKAASDIINGRGDLKTNISKLAYYGAVQNLMFNFLQQAVFALAFGDESDEEEKKKEEKLLGVANGMADSFLRGIGIAGAITATLKNALIRIIKESEKARPDYAETTIIQLLGISPPVQSKAQKIRSALKSYEWNKDEMKEKGFSLDNPAYLAGANVISAGFNVPLDRVVKKVDNIKNSTQEDISTLNRIMLLAGWSDWQLGIQKEEPKKSKNSRVKVRKSSSRTGKRKVTIR